jgi:hypothetical protein
MNNKIKNILSFCLFIFSFTAESISQEFSSSNLPIVIINTNGKTIRNDVRIAADMGIIYNGSDARNNLSDTPNNYNGRINIELRGSSSLMFPKKQYAFETQTATGENYNVSLLGMPEENDWILNGPYSDKSLIRNVLEFEIARKMGHYASRAALCELVLNNDYRGVYVLLEKIKRDDNRVDISRLEPYETSGDDLTGGYIIKIDKWAGEVNEGWTSKYPPYPGSNKKIFYQYHYPKPDNIVTEQKDYIKAFIDNFEYDMFTTDYSDPQNAFPEYINLESFVDFFILNEIGRNVDGYRLSTFFYKHKESLGGKFVIGPVWDFNLAFGNADYYNGSSISGWQVDFKGYGDGFQIPFWWKSLLDSDRFLKLLNNRWFSLRQNLLQTENVHHLVDSLVSLLAESQERNFKRWPVLGKYVWPNNFVGTTYSQEIDYMKNWIDDRLQWMDQNLPQPTSILAEPGVIKQLILEQNFPNPFNGSTSISYQLEESSEVKIHIYDLSGKKIRILVNSKKNAGKHGISWDARNDWGMKVPSGIYIYTLKTEQAFRARKLVLMK